MCLEKGCFLPENRIFLLILQCLPLFLPSLSHLPFSLSFLSFLSLALSLSIYIYIFFLFFFSCFFLPCFLSCFLPCFFCFLSWLVSLFCCMQRTTSNDYSLSLFSSIHYVFGVSCLVLSFQSPVIIFTFPYLKTLGPTSPNPSLLWCFCLSCFCFFVLGLFLVVFALFCLLCCWSGLVFWGFVVFLPLFLVIFCFVCVGVCCCFRFLFLLCSLACFCFVLCVCWSGLGVALVFLVLYFGVCFVCAVFLFLCACFFLFLMKIIVFPAILVFWGLMCMQSLFLISVSGSCFLFLFCLLFVSRCSLVSVFLRVAVLCFES